MVSLVFRSSCNGGMLNTAHVICKVCRIRYLVPAQNSVGCSWGVADNSHFTRYFGFVLGVFEFFLEFMDFCSVFWTFAWGSRILLGIVPFSSVFWDYARCYRILLGFMRF
jgi:hypothetical protein